MTDLTPPPERPMDDAARSRIGARLAAATATTGPGRARWLAPLGAAAAVLAIAVGAGYAALGPGGEGAAPAGPASSATAASTSPTRPDGAGTTTPGRRGGGGDSCARAVARQLRGATVAVSLDLPDGEAAIWVAGDRSVLCEDSGGIATSHRVRSVRPPAELAAEDLDLSSAIYDHDQQRLLAAYVAGGPLPEGVTGIDYTFPGGHTEPAELLSDGSGRRWWLMGHVPEDGPMADPDVNFGRLAPVRVVVSLSGVQHEHTLRWGVAGCAQVNHGC